MNLIKGVYGKIKSVEAGWPKTTVTFNDGAKHKIENNPLLVPGNTVMVDSHGKLWKMES